MPDPARTARLLAPRCGVAALLALTACDSGPQTGREWAQKHKPQELSLQVPGKAAGRLYADRKLPELARRNYGGYLTGLSVILKDKHLFNRAPVPVSVYLMADAEQFEKFGGAGLDLPGGFRPAEKAIYLLATGDPLVDKVLPRRMLRALSHAIIHDMLGGKPPAFFAAGLSRFTADGMIDPKNRAWVAGVPDPRWIEALRDHKLSWAQVRDANPEEFAAFGAPAPALATVVFYLLHSLDADQLWTIIYQVQLRGASDGPAVQKVIDEFLPAAAKLLENPLKSLFQLRPDYRDFCELAREKPSEKLLPRLLPLVGGGAKIGAYSWLVARCMAVAGKDPVAMLKVAVDAPPHRDQVEAMRELAARLHAAKQWQELEPVARKLLRSSVFPTPRSYRLLADSLAGQGKDAKGVAREGLALQVPGAEAEATRLRELAGK